MLYILLTMHLNLILLVSQEHLLLYQEAYLQALTPQQYVRVNS